MSIGKKGIGAALIAGGAALATGAITLYISFDSKKIKKCNSCEKDFMKRELSRVHETELIIDNSLSEYGYGKKYFLDKYEVSNLYEKYRNDDFSRFCAQCLKIEQEQLDKSIKTVEKNIEKDIEKLKSGAMTVQHYSKNYQGAIKHDRNCNINIASGQFKTMEDALYSLKLEATNLDCDMIYNLSYKKETENDGGNYYHTVWSASGIATKSID